MANRYHLRCQTHLHLWAECEQDSELREKELGLVSDASHRLGRPQCYHELVFTCGKGAFFFYFKETQNEAIKTNKQTRKKI